MSSGSRASVRRRFVLTAVPVLALVAVLVIPAGAVAAPGPSGVARTAAPSAASASFPARAGYAPWEAQVAAATGPATGSLPIDVVFAPRSADPVAPPAHGPVPAATYAVAAGLAPATYLAAEQYFRSSGLTVTHTWPDRLVLSLSGSPAAVDRAFGTTVESGRYDGHAVVFPTVPPSLPAPLEASVAGVVGLASGFTSFSFSLSPASPLAAPGASGTEITPANARSVYNVTNLLDNVTATPTYPTTEAIALVLWGDGYDPSDISTFFANDYPSGDPAPNVVPEPIDGAPAPSASALDSSDLPTVQELTLDIEWSASLAPGATIYPVYPPGESVAELTDAFEKALSLPNVVAVSMSFGAPESGAGSLNASWAPLFSEAASRGITVLAASGDFGGDANASCTGGPAPNYPASSPEVLAVGGTVLTNNGTLLSGPEWSESAWSGSGGGFSAVNSAPSWQKVGSAGTAINESGGGRGVPDVAGTASDDFVYFQGKDQEADGTSFATPLWAGIVADLDAVIGSPLGFVTPRLYHDASNERPGPDEGLVDITSGANCVARAGSGWDAVTGWGTPRASNLYYDLVGSFVNLTLSEAPAILAPGGSVTVQVAAANWTTGQPIAGLPVTISVASDTSYGPCVGTFGRVNASSNATGWATATISVPACYLGSHAIVSASVETRRLFGESSVHVAVNLLGFVPALAGLTVPPYSYGLYAGIMAIAVAIGGVIGRPKRPHTPTALPPPVPPVAPVVTPASAPGGPPGPVPPPAGAPRETGQGS